MIKKGQHYSVDTEIKKGQHLSPPTEFKNGSIPWNYREDGKVGMQALHSWVKRRLGKPQKCEHCGSTTAKKYEWANKSHEYKRDLSDWIRLCTSCHRKYDLTPEKKLKAIQNFPWYKQRGGSYV